MDNVININAVLTKGESMSDKATQTKKYKNLFEAIVTQVFDIDQYAFHMQELLKTLELVGHKKEPERYCEDTLFCHQ